MNNRRMLAIALGAGASALALTLLMPATASADDIKCMCTKKTFALPGECQSVCRGGLACPVVKCAISPTCGGGMDDTVFRQFYNQAIFGIGPVRGEAARGALLAQTITFWFKPNNITDFNVSWGKPDTDDWAHVVPPSSGAQKASLVVSTDALRLSPAGFINAIGHEMIHVEQMKRSYSMRFTGLNSALTSFRELEASTWEKGANDFKWSIPTGKWLGCMAPDEKKGFELTLACRDWQVKKAIEDLRTGFRSEQFIPGLEKYMNEDPWISQVWIKAHADWKTLKAGATPFAECTKP